MSRLLSATSTHPKYFLLKLIRTILLSFYIVEAGIVALFLFFLLLNGQDWAGISAGGFGESRMNIFLWCLVMSIGLFLIYFVQRFPSLYPRIWGILLILVGTILGSVLSLLIISYKNICCMFAYSTINGYPFAGVARTLTLDSHVQWAQVYLYMQIHPEQIHWDFSWISLFLNGLFYAHASFILVVILHSVIRSSVGLKKG